MPEKKKCKFDKTKVKIRVSSYSAIPAGESNLLASVKLRPTIVAIPATDAFMEYKKGVFEETCKRGQKIDHGSKTILLYIFS